MDKRQVIINTLQHKESDYVPYNFEFTEETYEKMAEYYQDANVQERVNNHLLIFEVGGFTEGPEKFFTDEYGVVWNRTVDSDIGVVENLLIDDYDTRTYKLPDIDTEAIKKGLEWLRTEKKDRFTIFKIGFSMFERAWTLHGMENVLMDMLVEKDNLHGLLEEITEHNLRAIEMAVECDFVDAIMFGDDWGSQRGLIMGRELWCEFIKPQMKKMYALAKEHGKFVFQHSCGYIEDIFPDLIEIGLNCYQTFQPELYDVKRVKEKFGDKLTFWGGISTQQLLPFATPEEVKQETRRMMEIMGKNGGYIAAPTHAMPRDIPLENMLAMVEVFQSQHNR